jgi:hypothetical protein
MLQIDHFSIGTLPIDLSVTGDFPDISDLPIDLSVVPIEKWVSKRHILYTKNNNISWHPPPPPPIGSSGGQHRVCNNGLPRHGASWAIIRFRDTSWIYPRSYHCFSITTTIMTIVVVAVADANPGIDGDVDASVINFLFHPRARDRGGENQRQMQMRGGT